MNRERLDAALPAFDIGESIGRGGYGVVFTARHRRIGWQAAVKVLADGDTDARLRDRFVAEATSLAELDHPHIVRIHDYVEHDGLCLLVMERLDGPMLHKRPGLTAVEACGAGLAVSDALAAVHQRGILHRDIRPENLLYSSDGTLKVVGFGTVSDGASLISAASGTPAYTAPERIQGFRLGPATDVYSLGVLLYELFSGRLPFSRDLPLSALLHHHVNVPAPWLSDIPRPLATVLDRALSKDANDRQRSAHEFAVELGAAAASALGPDWLEQVTVPVRVSGRVRDAAHGRAPSSAVTRQQPARAGVALPSGAGVSPVPTGGAPVSGVPAAGRVATAPPDPGAAPALPEPELTRRARAAFGDSTGRHATLDVDTRRRHPEAPDADDPGSGGPDSGAADAGGPDLRDPGLRDSTDEFPDEEPRRPRRRWRWWAVGVATLAVIGASALVVVKPWNTAADDGAPVIRTSTPRGLVVDQAGNLYLSDVSNRQVRKISPSGQVTVVAGTGPQVKAGSGGDGGDAVKAQLAFPQSLALGPDGSFYIADTAEGRVRQVTTDGKIRTVVGAAPTAEEADDATNAQAAQLPNFFVIATGRDGELYVAESGSGKQRIRRLKGDGLSNVAENPSEDDSEGGAELEQIRSVAVGSDGRVYVADRGHKLIWGVKPGDPAAAVAGGGTMADCPSKIVQNGPDALAIGQDDQLYVGSYGLCELRTGGSARELVTGRYIDAVAAGGNGDVYFISQNTIYKRTSAGKLTEVRG